MNFELQKATNIAQDHRTGQLADRFGNNWMFFAVWAVLTIAERLNNLNVNIEKE